MSLSPSIPAPVDARLILSDDALDRTLELFLLAEAALWMTADGGLDGEPHRLGRGHYRAAFLLKRRPGLGVQDLAHLTGLSKQGASRVLGDLCEAGYALRDPSEADARRRPVRLTEAGEGFEARVSHRLRQAFAKAYRAGGLDMAPHAAAVLSALAATVLRDADLPA